MKRAFYFGVLLCGFWFCLAAFAAGEITRTYNYKGFDTNGNLLVRGTITLRVDETRLVRGDWSIRVLDRNKLKETGPQDGSGKIVGESKGDTLFLNLNPQVFGDNVYLDGKVTKANIFKISGKWGHYGYYLGKLNEGNFEMERKKDH